MKILLDTHVFLWFISGDIRLPDAFKGPILDPDNEVFLSVVSIWEAVIKSQLCTLHVSRARAVLNASRNASKSNRRS
jgi:PIN domain nuclease of toxin-antitoxin system